MKKLVSLIAFCFCSVLLFAQGNVDVKGKVTDENGKAIANVEVVVKNTTQTVKTNDQGEYTVSLPEGKYVFKFTRLSYGTKTVLAQVVSNTELDVALEKIQNSKTSRR